MGGCKKQKNPLTNQKKKPPQNYEQGCDTATQENSHVDNSIFMAYRIYSLQLFLS